MLTLIVCYILISAAVIILIDCFNLTNNYLTEEIMQLDIPYSNWTYHDLIDSGFIFPIIHFKLTTKDKKILTNQTCKEF